jgi:hypothetical protein
MQLYTAVQRAGPRLSPASVQQGLESFRRDSPGPQSPTGWYGPGDHSFLKDMTVGLFNPTGQTPGGQDPASKGSGCYQLGLDAHRYLAGQWPAQDTVTAPPTPCPADLQPHTNSNADNGSGTPAPSG